MRYALTCSFLPICCPLCNAYLNCLQSQSHRSLLFYFLMRAFGSNNPSYAFTNTSADEAFPTQQFNSVVSIKDANNSTPSLRSRIIVNGGSEIVNNSNTHYTTGNISAENYTLGRSASAASFLFERPSFKTSSP